MAITSTLFGPKDYNPHFARDEFQYCRIVGDGTVVLVATGAGSLKTVDVGVAGTLAKFYDVASGGVTDATTEIATVDTSITGYRANVPVAFAKGLTCVTTGGNTDITISFRGRPDTSSRTFGAPGAAG